MKMHISRIYGISESFPFVIAQKRLSDAGHSLGFYDLGLYSYPVSCDSDSELSSRIDGIISGIERGDIVFLQLPTGNGFKYDHLLFSRLKLYGATVILVFSDTMDYSDYVRSFNTADCAVVPTKAVLQMLQSNGLDIHTMVKNISSSSSEIHLKKVLLEISCAYSDVAVSSSVDSVHVCFGVHDRTGEYCSYVATTMQSIINNTSSAVCFHILIDDSVSSKSISMLKHVASGNGHSIKFHLIDKSVLNSDNSWLKLYSVGSLFRLLIPDIFKDLTKIIYLDSDLFFMKDIELLWKTDLGENAVAAVNDIGFSRGICVPNCISSGIVKESEYFNSGLIVMNLEKIRSMGNLCEMCMNYIKADSSTMLPDQDALNVIFAGKVLLLDHSWNVMTKYERYESIPASDCVYHYAGEPYVIFSHLTGFDKEYLTTKNQTPWIDKSVSDFYVGINSAYYHISTLQKFINEAGNNSRKKIIYYGINTLGMRKITKIIPPKEGDYFILTDPVVDHDGTRFGVPIKDFESLTSEEAGSFIVLVLADAEGGQALQKLNSLGLSLNKDYFVIQSMLTVEQGGYL